MRERIKVGDIYESAVYGRAEVIELLRAPKIKIKFLATGYECVVFRGNLPRGSFRDPYARVVEGVGYMGVGVHCSRSRAFNVWNNMIKRCYEKIKAHNNVTYEGCSVESSWHNYQNFAEWYYKQLNNGVNELDKDLLVRGNKVYSEDTCTLIPYQLNIALQENRVNRGHFPPGVYFKKKNKNFIAQLALGDGVQKHLASCATAEEARRIYLSAKKEQLKELAEQYKHLISEEAYHALYKWESLYENNCSN